MNAISAKSTIGSLAVLILLSGCAGTVETLVTAPSVELRSVQLARVDLTAQTFLLDFEVSNPNAFPLPIRALKYRVMFDEERFAGGETSAAFSVPAHGTGAFQLSVDLDLMNSASQISSLLHGGIPDHVNYRVDGSFAVDIPFTKPLSFATSGAIGIQH